jgi:hypothetical protein
MRREVLQFDADIGPTVCIEVDVERIESHSDYATVRELDGYGFYSEGPTSIESIVVIHLRDEQS